VGTNRTYSNERDRMNECSGCQKPHARIRRERRGNKKGSLCNGCG